LAAALISAVFLLLAVSAISVSFGISQRNFGIYQKEKAEELRQEKEATMRQSAMLMLERGLGLCEQHDEALGMIWLAQSLKNIPAEDDALRRMLLSNLSNWQIQLHPLRNIFSLESEAMCVAFSPDGKRFVTGHDDRHVRLWESATGNLVWSRREHKANVWAVAFSPNGEKIISGGDDNTVLFWQTSTGQPAGKPLQTKERARSLALCLDGQRFLIAEDYQVQLYDIQDGKPQGRPVLSMNAIAAAAVSPDGT